jgi:hypothetical protein
MDRRAKSERELELELLLRIARDHDTCEDERPEIDGNSIVIPFDCLHRDPDRWTIAYERVSNRRELLDALGY